MNNNLRKAVLIGLPDGYIHNALKTMERLFYVEDSSLNEQDLIIEKQLFYAGAITDINCVIARHLEKNYAIECVYMHYHSNSRVTDLEREFYKDSGIRLSLKINLPIPSSSDNNEWFIRIIGKDKAALIKYEKYRNDTHTHSGGDAS